MELWKFSKNHKKKKPINSVLLISNEEQLQQNKMTIIKNPEFWKKK